MDFRELVRLTARFCYINIKIILFFAICHADNKAKAGIDRVFEIIANWKIIIHCLLLLLIYHCNFTTKHRK